jgi:ADP-heptose:LPS heptosyltransferase
MNKFWIVKLGALGDLVRTSFFFKNLSKLGQINVVGESWRVVGANPYINKIYNSVEDMMKEYDCGKVFSMEDCPEIINLLSNKFHNSLISGFYKKDQNILYTPESAAWNDMGINSRFGLDTANILKKNNYYTFDECHRVWLGCMEYPEIFDSSGSLMQSNKPIKKFLRVGFCPISNGRWKNKSLTFLVVSELISYFKSNGYGISLIGEVEGTFLEDSSFEQYRVETPSRDSWKYAILD